MLQGIIDEAANQHRVTDIAMARPLITLAVTMLVLACGPNAGNEDDIPGELVYEERGERLYRFDRRVDLIYDYEREDGLERKCGILTDRAYGELESTLAALEPSVDYGDRPANCSTSGALVHVEDFEHSPFECAFGCCHPDLLWAAVVYTMILNNLVPRTNLWGRAGRSRARDGVEALGARSWSRLEEDVRLARSPVGHVQRPSGAASRAA